MELCLSVPPQRECCEPNSAGDRKHVWMCGCSGNVFALSRSCVYITWNVVVNGGVCPCSAWVARSNEQTHMHTWSLETGIFQVTPSFWHEALWMATFSRTCCVLFKWCHWLKKIEGFAQQLFILCLSVTKYKPHLACMNSIFCLFLVKLNETLAQSINLNTETHLNTHRYTVDNTGPYVGRAPCSWQLDSAERNTEWCRCCRCSCCRR